MSEYKRNDVIIRFTKDEFEYLSELCNSFYKTLKVLPKKTRTFKFYLLENMIHNYFIN